MDSSHLGLLSSAPPLSMPSNRPRNPRAHSKVNDLFNVASNHRWPAMPSARELGITSVRRAALIRIRVIYGEMADQLSYLNVRDMERLLVEAEALMALHFPEEQAALLAARQPVPFPDQQPSTSVATEPRALAS